MRQDANGDRTTPGTLGVNRRTVLRAVGATAVVGGVVPGVVAGQNTATWNGEGSEHDEEGCSDFKFVLAPAGARDPSLGDATLYNDGTAVATASRNGRPGAIVFPAIDGPLGTVTATYTGDSSGAKLVLSSSECDGGSECKPCESLDIKFESDGTQGGISISGIGTRTGTLEDVGDVPYCENSLKVCVWGGREQEYVSHTVSSSPYSFSHPQDISHVVIRCAGDDCPERPGDGQPGGPGAQEADEESTDAESAE